MAISTQGKSVVRLAILSDAHCNSIGLRVCLEKIATLAVDQIYFLGDAVGYLSGPEIVLQILKDESIICLKGNHEAMLLGSHPLSTEKDRLYQLQHQRENLSRESRNQIQEWPESLELEIGNERILLVHASPRPSLTEHLYADTLWLAPKDFPYSRVFMGHTHRPFVRQEGQVQLVNVGSCGLPRDQGHLSSFAIYDSDEKSTQVYRVPFMTAAAIDLHGCGVEPEVLALFERRQAFYGNLL